jgi:Uma2 family endonuclease
MNEISPHAFIAEEEFIGFSVKEFLDLCEAPPLNIWEGKLELVQGAIIRMAPPAWPHSEVQRRLFRALDRILGDGIDGWIAGQEVSFTLLGRDRTMRQPDVSIFRIPDAYDRVFTSDALLMAIEVSDTTLKQDLTEKRDDYAGAGIGLYWVADVNRRETHIFSDPADGDYRKRDLVPFGNELMLPQGLGSITL